MTEPDLSPMQHRTFKRLNTFGRRMLLFASLLALFATAVPLLGYIVQEKPLTDIMTCIILGLPSAILAFCICLLLFWEFRVALAEHHRKTMSKPADNAS
jgi:uncharacterized BrkB/YihY/UPF0761 family membrane protein